MIDNNILAALVVVSIVISLGGVFLVTNTGGRIGMGTGIGQVGMQLDAETTITLVNADVAFGTVALGQVDDTTDELPRPFYIINDGSVPVDITIGATRLFTNAVFPGPNYQFMCGGTSETLCPAGSVVLPIDMPDESSPILAVKSLGFVDTEDEIEIEIAIVVPMDELAGSKTSTVTLTATEAI
ncbi:MAG: hypothetical protein ABIF08_01065 [Nanoarchaeota archaeon]